MIKPLNHVLEPYLRHIRPDKFDPTYSILKAHLLFEEMLRNYLDKMLPRPAVLRGARLSFSQILAVAQAISTSDDPTDTWNWQAIGKLNKLRNLLSHELEPVALQEMIDQYINFIITQSGVPLPTQAHGSDSSQTITNDASHFTAIDVVTAGLYVSCDRYFEFELLKKRLAMTYSKLLNDGDNQPV